MRLEELDFDLPAEAIAQRPAEPRDSCKLMRLMSTGDVEHARFFELERILRPGDALIVNDSKVLPARLEARKLSGGATEILFLRPASVSSDGGGVLWEALVKPSKRLRVGAELVVGETERVVLLEALGEGRWVVGALGGGSLVEIMERHGRLPLPPYVTSYPDDPSVYQTIYASALGSAAAPTAGLHFTDDLLGKLSAKGVEIARVTLHVGLDTFLPIRESVVEEHRIHTESYEVSGETLTQLRATRATGGRVVAVGTTVTRVLETIGRAGALADGCGACDLSGSTNIFITPGYEFVAVDALLTNLHLPRSTVLALTMAFAGVERIKEAYREAVANQYRFFSFGDAMLIEREVQSGQKGGGRRAEP